MTCSTCLRAFVDGEPVVSLYVSLEGRDLDERFTGIALHVACMDQHRDQVADDVEALRAPERSEAS